MIDLPVLVCDRLNGARFDFGFRVVRTGAFRVFPCLFSKGDPFVRVDFEGGVVSVRLLVHRRDVCTSSRHFSIVDPDFYDNLINYMAECCLIAREV